MEQVFYLNESEMQEAIAMYLSEKKDMDIENGLIFYAQQSDGLVKVVITEIAQALVN